MTNYSAKQLIDKAEALIFDLDGTLLDSMPMWDNLMPEFFASQGVVYQPQYFAELYNLPFNKVADVMAVKYFSHLTGPQIMQKWQDYLAYHYGNTIPLKPGVAEFLQRIGQAGKKMCVATMTDRCYVEPVLARLKVESYIQFILTVGEVGKGKEQPDIYLLAAEKMQTQVGRCLVFEDSVLAAETAARAGFLLCGVLDQGSACESDKLKKITNTCIKDFNELL